MPETRVPAPSLPPVAPPAAPPSTPAPSAAPATAVAAAPGPAAAQSLLSQAGSVVSDAEDLLHGAAETLNWMWEWFQPGQGWRLAFGAAAAVLGYLGLRQWGLIPPATTAAKAA
jgi:hypothetical protein